MTRLEKIQLAVLAGSLIVLASAPKAPASIGPEPRAGESMSQDAVAPPPARPCAECRSV